MLGGHPLVLVIKGKTQRLRFVLDFDEAQQIDHSRVAQMSKQLELGPFASRTRGCRFFRRNRDERRRNLLQE
ncbi:hypothetical protein D3C73_1283970 [compost metagenome]